MRVLSMKPGHDGSVAYVDDGRLVLSHEAEKDSFDRHAELSPQLVLGALQLVPDFPDVLAMGGWHKLLPGALGAVGAGYRGLRPGDLVEVPILGRNTIVYSSSHERSHVIGGVAMSPFSASEPMALLVWEGIIGSLYLWRGPDQEIEAHEVLDQPGARYSALFALAEPTFPDSGSFPPTEYAGKLMALAGWADDVGPTTDSKQVVDSILKTRSLYPFHKALYRRSGLYNVGVETPELCRTARYLTKRIFEIYADAAERLLPSGLPFVITGGCALNCEWNARWHAHEHFSDVFVPPCADDSGSAIGTAMDAQLQLTGACDLEWDVYSGLAFVEDADPRSRGWIEAPFSYSAVSDALHVGKVVAWVQGRCEIGPRALGNRSLLASAQDPGSRAKLNKIKQREAYRPIAPVCLEEDLADHFDSGTPDPYMLTFRRVLWPTMLPSVTHADQSARVQSVTESSNPRLHRLLVANRQRHGVGVLCNTSLNFRGRGFINRTSELLQYCKQAGIEEVVIEGRWYRDVPAAEVEQYDRGRESTASRPSGSARVGTR